MNTLRNLHVHPKNNNLFYYKCKIPDVRSIQLFYCDINLFGETILESIPISAPSGGAGTYEIFDRRVLEEHGCDLKDPTTWDNTPCIYIGQVNDSSWRCVFDRLTDFRTCVFSGLGRRDMQKSPYENGLRYGKTHTAEDAGNLIARVTVYGFHSIDTPLSNQLLWREYQLLRKHIVNFGKLPEQNQEIVEPNSVLLDWPISREEKSSSNLENLLKNTA